MGLQLPAYTGAEPPQRLHFPACTGRGDVLRAVSPSVHWGETASRDYISQHALREERGAGDCGSQDALRPRAMAPSMPCGQVLQQASCTSTPIVLRAPGQGPGAPSMHCAP